MPAKKLFNKGAGPEVRAVALVAAKIVTGHADLGNERQQTFHPEQGMALPAFDIHLQKRDLADFLLFPNLLKRRGLNLNA